MLMANAMTHIRFERHLIDEFRLWELIKFGNEKIGLGAGYAKNNQ
jgi:hypothetical protein